MNREKNPHSSVAELIPKEWQVLLRSREHAGARASIRANGSEVPVDFTMRFEFVDKHRLAIYVTLAESDPWTVTAPRPALERALTNREREVVTLIAAGHETSQIAEELNISPETVRTHVRNAMSKLGARTRAQLVAVALSAG